MGIVERSRALYWRFLDNEMRLQVEAMDEGDSAYFWTMLHYEMQHNLGKVMLDAMEEDARRRVAKEGKAEPEALPFKAVEASISPASWFTRPSVKGML